MSKPTLVLIHGMWHQPAHFAPLMAALDGHGYRSVAPALPSVTQAPTTSLEPDVEAVRAAATAEFALGNDVVLVPHSYGGLVAMSAVRGLDKPSRVAAGESTGIVALAAITAVTVGEGVGIPEAEQRPREVFTPADGSPIINPIPAGIFYSDMPAAEVDKYAALLKPMSVAAALSPCTFSAHHVVPIHYLHCTADNCFKLPVQQRVVDWLRADPKNKGVRTETLEGSSHSPYLSRLDETVAFIRRSAGESV